MKSRNPLFAAGKHAFRNELLAAAWQYYVCAPAEGLQSLEKQNVAARSS